MAGSVRFPLLDDRNPIVICENERGELFSVPVVHRGAPPAGRRAMSRLRKLLKGVPGLEQFVAVYERHDGIGLFAARKGVEDDGAVQLAPVETWAALRGEMFKWFFDGVKPAFQGLPYGPKDIVPFAMRNYSPDRWFVIRRGAMAGQIGFWGHDGEPLSDVPVARDLASFFVWLTEHVNEAFGGVNRYSVRVAIEPGADPFEQLFPRSYSVS